MAAGNMEQREPLGEKVPDMGTTGNVDAGAGGGESIVRRNNRGCKSKDFYNWPEQSLEEMDSPLAVQQYIQQLINRDPADTDEILKLPEGQDLGAWKIEHLRLFCMQLNRIAARLQDCCYPETCNQMTATEQWIFLCAAHKQPNECPAIDYTRHALDNAASLLNSSKYFPSRVTIKESSVAKLGSVCRRVYRIFSHAYYHHFQVFDEFERATHLCERFSKFVTMYDLLPKESLIVPSDGSKPETEIGQKTNSSPSDTAVTDHLVTNSNPADDDNVVSKEAHEIQSRIEPTELASHVDKTNSTVSTIPITTSASAHATDAKTILQENKSEVKSKIEEKAPLTSQPMTTAVAASPKTQTSWSPTKISTNTMVKGASSGAATKPEVVTNEFPVDKAAQIKSEPTTVSTTKTTTANESS